MQTLLIDEAIGFNLGVRGISIVLSGLQQGYAEIGAGIGVQMSPPGLPDGGVKWSDDADPLAAAAFGTGPGPADFSVLDGQRLYLHAIHQGRTYTRSAPVRQAAAPVMITAPAIAGAAVSGEVPSGTAGVFSGAGVTLLHRWQSSPDGLGGWSDTGTAGLTGPAMQIDLFYRLLAVATNTKGEASAASNVIGPVQGAAIIGTVSVGTASGGNYPVDISASGVTDGDMLHWVIYSAAESDPSATQVVAGQQQDGTAAPGSGSDVWAADGNFSAVATLASGDYKMAAVINNGASSNVGVSSAFTVVSAGYALTFVAATPDTSAHNVANTVDLTGISEDDWLIIAVSKSNGNSSTLNPPTLEGVAAVSMGTPVGTGSRDSELFVMQCPAAAAGNAAAEIVMGSSNGIGRFVAGIYETVSEPQAVAKIKGGGGSVTVVDCSYTAAGGRDLIVVGQSYNTTDYTITAGATEDAKVQASGDNRFTIFGSEANVSAGTHTVTLAPAASNAANAVSYEVWAV